MDNNRTTPKSTSTITRTKRVNNFTVLGNHIFADNHLSWRAMGLLSYLLSKPDDWRIYVNQLVHVTEGTTWNDKRNTVYKILKELQAAGYVAHHRNADGSVDWSVSDQPHDKICNEGKKPRDKIPNEEICHVNKQRTDSVQRTEQQRTPARNSRVEKPEPEKPKQQKKLVVVGVKINSELAEQLAALPKQEREYLQASLPQARNPNGWLTAMLDKHDKGLLELPKAESQQAGSASFKTFTPPQQTADEIKHDSEAAWAHMAAAMGCTVEELRGLEQ
jgi:Fe2+ or Zn2+ uptake regulation protein